ncbi:MAG TPA: NAD(P)H-dependent oxidoreductase subunit E [Acidobacteriota bacterium]|nr:NAD(P)H-dependent oxidoreductase subunit E [Acidobacteriota bacterium]
MDAVALKILIDDVKITGRRGMTILDAAGEAGIAIPSLCHHRNLVPAGSCRICVVDIEGSKRLVGSCHTPIEEGMVIHTGSPKVIAARRAIVELLMAGHTGPCLNDTHAAQCDLHMLASDLQTGPPRFRVRKPRYYEPEEANPYIRRDMSRCILCSRCVGVCNDLAGKKVFGTAYRGFGSKVIVDFDGFLDKEICRECLLCVDYCPTSALGVRGREKAEPEEKPAPAGSAQGSDDRNRANLLPRLKKAQESFHCVSRGIMADTAQSMGLSVSDVYGVSTFYSFLSTRPTGENVIRVCGSLPCYVKNSRAILRSIEELLGIRPGETTPDGLFSLETANCIGACDRSPAMLVNSDLHGNLTPAKIAGIIKSYRSGRRPGGERQCKTRSF